jgi:hypothetical protein
MSCRLSTCAFASQRSVIGSAARIWRRREDIKVFGGGSGPPPISHSRQPAQAFWGGGAGLPEPSNGGDGCQGSPVRGAGQARAEGPTLTAGDGL